VTSISSHKDLEVWRRSVELVKRIYDITQSFPKEELYGLTNQIRRSAVSIPSNIAEGAARNHHKEFIQFLYITLGSISELEIQVIISEEFKFLKIDQSHELQKELLELKNMTLGLIRHSKRRRDK